MSQPSNKAIPSDAPPDSPGLAGLPAVMAGGASNPGAPGTVLEREATLAKPPPRYTVWLLNDDYTPMEFVVLVLQKFFSMDREKATQVMLRVHREGRGVCGVFSRELAETKVEQVNSFSRANQHPLQCVMEEA